MRCKACDELMKDEELSIPENDLCFRCLATIPDGDFDPILIEQEIKNDNHRIRCGDYNGPPDGLDGESN